MDRAAAATKRGTAFVVSALSAAFVSAVALPGNPPGLNLVATGALALIAIELGRSGSRDRLDVSLLSLAAITIGSSAVRASPWLISLNLVAFVSLLSIAAARANDWRSLASLGPRAAAGLPRGVLVPLSPLVEWLAPTGKRELRPVLRAFILSGALLLIFGLLFGSADPAFASFAYRYGVPHFDLGLLPVRVVIGGLTLAGIGSLVLLSAAPSDGDGSPLSSRFSAIEWKSALLVIDLLFVAFVAVQLTVLFGGQDHVLTTTGLTYAQYARQGFFQLLVVAFLTLGVIGAVAGFTEAEGRDRTWMKVLLGILVATTLVILASAMKRMNLYQDAYGFTHLRFFVDVTLLWLAAIFLMLAVAGVRWNGRWIAPAVVTLSACTVIALNVANPDLLIARWNIERFERTGRVDLTYVSILSADAAPAVDGAPEPVRSCLIASLSDDKDSSSFWSWNWSRARASSLLANEDPVGSSCPLVFSGP